MVLKRRYKNVMVVGMARENYIYKCVQHKTESRVPRLNVTGPMKEGP